MPHQVDVHVGGRIRLRRRELDMSQQQLGEKLGISFQQVQKYEKGTNRVGASRLWQIAEILNVHIRFFFEGLEGAPEAEEEHIQSRVIELAQLIETIRDEEVRKQVLNLIKACKGMEA